MPFEKPVNGTKTADQAASVPAKLERKSTEELFLATLEGEYDDDAAWEAVTTLRLRGLPEVFEVARRYCESENAKARARGLSVMAQLGAGKPASERPFLADSVCIAVEHLTDSDPEVVRSAAWALSHLGTQPAVASLFELRNHADPEVRQAVACCIEFRKHPAAVPTLLALMEDESEVVRDWATFALGQGDFIGGGRYIYADSPEIRAGFRRRLEDSYEEARREAIWGLAKRKDPLGVKLLLNHLESADPWNGDKDAAEELLHTKSDAPIEELCDGLRGLLT
jgi:HEAT repeat protein